jgi:UDP-glucose 4-epimerase
MRKIVEGDPICKQYNLGINKSFSVLELINITELVTGQKVQFEVKDRRPGDPSRLIADSTKAQTELSWSPKHLDVKDMIESTYLFFKNKKI